jgi:hypothetical protein
MWSTNSKGALYTETCKYTIVGVTDSFRLHCLLKKQNIAAQCCITGNKPNMHSRENCRLRAFANRD